MAPILVAFVVLGGGSSHQYKLVFQTAGQLVDDNSVEVGGRRVGSVKKIQLTDDNRAEITVEVKEPYAPLRGTTAVVRLASLSGVANRYIALTPGPTASRSSTTARVIAEDSTTSIVDLDQLFNTLDADPRRPDEGHPGLRRLVRRPRRGRHAVGQVLRPVAVGRLVGGWSADQVAVRRLSATRRRS